MDTDTATRLANPVIVKRTPLVTFAVGQITDIDILDALADGTGLEWKLIKYHVGGRGDVWYAKSDACPEQEILLDFMPSGATCICYMDNKHFGERDYGGTEMLVKDRILPRRLFDWVRKHGSGQA